MVVCVLINPSLLGQPTLAKAHLSEIMRPHPLTAAFDNAKLLAAENVVDEVIKVARLHSVEVLIIKHGQDLLAQYAGIAAIQYAVPIGSRSGGRAVTEPDALRPSP